MLNCDSFGNAAMVGAEDADGKETNDGGAAARADWWLPVDDELEAGGARKGAVVLDCDCVGNAVTVSDKDAGDTSGEANDGDADTRADWWLPVDDELETDGAHADAVVLNCDCVGNAVLLVNDEQETNGARTELRLCWQCSDDGRRRR